MGQQLNSRPISQQAGFATLGGNSSPFAADPAQFRGFMTPAQPKPGVGPYAPFRRVPITLGGLRYNPVMSRVGPGALVNQVNAQRGQLG